VLANAATTFITINEVTTVATVYALAPFVSDYANVGYASGNGAGMTNAFATEHVLVDTATGFAQGSSTGGVTLPTAAINSLADSIAACINSASNASAACSALFTATGVTASHLNTVAALAALAHNPASNVGTIFGLAGATAPFQPQLSKAPGDWTLSIYYNGGGLSAPTGIAIDATGNAWVAWARRPLRLTRPAASGWLTREPITSSG
jgi:hypothetical protein